MLWYKTTRLNNNKSWLVILIAVSGLNGKTEATNGTNNRQFEAGLITSDGTSLLKYST